LGEEWDNEESKKENRKLAEWRVWESAEVELGGPLKSRGKERKQIGAQKKTIQKKRKISKRFEGDPESGGHWGQVTKRGSKNRR